MSAVSITGLTLEGCRDRQHILREYLRSLKIEAALIVDPRHVYSLTGFWSRRIYAPMCLIERDGPTTLAVPFRGDVELAAEEVVPYEAAKFCTLADDQPRAALAVLAEKLTKFDRLGCDGGLRPGLLDKSDVIDLYPTLLAVRRCKDDDEVAFLRQIIAVTEAAYARARRDLRPGVTEVELWAGMQHAIAEAAGEMLGEFGNDFQIGSTGSAPRRRAAEAGEAAILDLSVVLRGYHSDMCRTFVVGQASEPQRAAHARIMEVFDMVEKTARAGTECRKLDEAARTLLDGYRGWSFGHHLGHGVGMNGHEAPRINPESSDRLQVGDVFTIEPGLYGADLKAGLRIEQMYHVTERGLDRLTTFGVEL